MAELWLASVLFVGSHLGISSTPLRRWIVGIVGEKLYIVFYIAITICTLSYFIWVYGAIPNYEYFWTPDPSLYWIPKLLVPIACVLLLGGFMVPNPTTIGMAASARSPDPARGVVRVTRHPFLWAVILWGFSHLVTNGDKVSVLFFATFIVAALVGGVLLDRKKAQQLGDTWPGFADKTSNIPFVAIISGRNKLIFRELWLPVVVGLGFAAAAFFGHEWLAGVGLY